MKAYNPYLIGRARSMRKEMTSPERKLWFECLRNLPNRLRRQRPIGHYIVDFYCSELKMVIEVDGDSHFDSPAIAYDRERTVFLQDKGLHVLRFTNQEISHQFEDVKARIFAELSRRHVRDASPTK